ncbi:MAG: membrane protein insertion efficiency factor YidD [Candidatus Omnitrophica bacterium]|nr:membrane protein insertion efficiency factor YidD [Candidatus Omnitrophota bacterium]
MFPRGFNLKRCSKNTRAAAEQRIKNLLKHIIRLYKIYLAPAWPSHCRFYPSCSEYYLQAVDKKGVFVGTLMTVIRLLKCNPLFPGGEDIP